MPTNPVFIFPCLVLFILNASSCSAESEYFVRFVPKVPAKQQSYYYESPGPVDPIELDASSAQQVRVRIVDYMNTPPKVIIHCRIAPLDRKAHLISAQLCNRKKLVDQDTCIDPNKQAIQFGNVKFESVGNRTHGYNFTTRLPVGSVQLDAFYFCKFRNIQGEVSSNMMEVQDVYYYQTKLVDLPSSGDTYLEPLTPSNFPLTLQCGSSSSHGIPAPTNYNSPSPFRWSFCQIDDPNSLMPYNCWKQARNNPIRVSVYFQHIVFPNGTLILLKRTAATWADMGLICHSHLRPSKYYAVYFGGTEQNPAPIQINPSEPYTKSGITILSPTSQRVVVRDGSDGDVTLMAIYQTNPSTLRYTWTKNGDPITLGFQETTPFTLQFPPTRHRNHSGTYQLKVWSGDSTARFVYDVDVVGPPEVVEPPPPFLLIMAGNEATFSCRVERFTTQALRINGQVLDPSSSSRQSKLINLFPYLKNTVIHPLRTDGSRIHYRVSNLVFPQGSLFGSSHTVTIVTGNQYGYAFVSTMIHVLPSPKVIKSPSRSPCGPPCSSLQEHHFDCRFDLKPYGLTHVKQSWMLNDTDVSMLHQQRDERSEFLVDDGTVLNLNPVPNPERAQLFAHSRATCRLRLYYPAVLKEASTSAGDLAFMNPKFIIYDSSLDPKISPDLSVDINLIAEDPPPPKSAKISWLGFVLIAVCIVLIIGVLTMCIVMRTRGETYHLDKKEHLFGLDPQKELLEDEAFHTYERAEEPPLRGSRCSLNDDSAEIGSDADGELDDYNLDPGKFNEEGSFIDQYATDTHYRSTSRLPV